MSTSSQSVSVIFDAPGPKGRLQGRIVGVAGVLLCIALVAALVWRLKGQLLDPVKWKPFLSGGAWTTFVLPGLISTLQAAAVSVVLALILGLILGMGRLSHLPVINIPAGALVEFFRSVPVLMMMLFFYYLFLFSPDIVGTQLIYVDYVPFWSVVIGLTLYNGSVIAELIRSGVHSLPKGQGEAGTAIGLTRGQTLINVLLPQAITAMLPSLLSQLVVVLKDTALGFIVTYPDLLRSMQTWSSSNGNILAALTVAALIYIVLNYALTLGAAAVERRLRTRRAGKSVGVGAVPVRGTANTNVRPDA